MPRKTMEISWRKHRDQEDHYAADLSAKVADGVTLSAPEVEIERHDGRLWVDVTAEFIAIGVQVVGQEILTTLKRASGAQQAPGLYRVTVRAASSDSQDLVDVFLLDVEG